MKNTLLFYICEKQRHGSAVLPYLLISSFVFRWLDSVNLSRFELQNFKSNSLVRFVLDLVGNPEERFYHVKAPMILWKNLILWKNFEKFSPFSSCVYSAEERRSGKVAATNSNTPRSLF